MRIHVHVPSSLSQPRPRPRRPALIWAGPRRRPRPRPRPSYRPASVRGLIFLNDRRGNTAALAYLLAALARPLPNFRAPLAAGPRAGLAPPGSATSNAARMLDVSREAVVQFLSMR